MQVDSALILKLESLALLELSEDERVMLQKDLEHIIGMVDKLQEIDTTGLEPLIHLGNYQSILREDQVKGQLSREDALSNADIKDEKYFLVPKVIEK
ncbi:MAG: Asp-tRNA(Asn)/Glu-tRNA(Gln) amidotransferase subunit GatC [Saprospiraceae bacterium]